VNELKVTFAGQTYSFKPGHTVRIGRAPDNAVVIPDSTVSREHAQVRWQTDGWVLDDLGKGRTFVGGIAVHSVSVHQPLDVRLATPAGPELRIDPGSVLATSPTEPGWSATRAQPTPIGWEDVALSTNPAAPVTHISTVEERTDTEIDGDDEEARHPSAIHRSKLWRGDISGTHSGPAHNARFESPGGDFATAVHILLPVRSWLKDTGWKQGSRLLVIAYGLLPSLFVVLFSSTTDVNVPGWAYSLAIAPLWAVAFWLLIRPGRITKLIAWLAVAIAAAVLVLLPVMTLPWENALDNTMSARNVLPWIYGVGFAEEVTKALPILAAALALRWIWKTTLDVRVWMFLGTIAGLTFGVRESALYTSSYLMQGQHRAGLAIPLILSFAQRVFVDGFQHAVWTGIAAFFIGMGVNYRRRRIPLIIFGITLPAVLHGLNDWSTQLASHWLWILMEAVSLLLFIGYTMSAATIERQVRDTPLFRGESMIMDRVRIGPDGEEASS
jgi:protease PrsW